MARRASTSLKDQVTDNLARTFDGGWLRVYTGNQPPDGDLAGKGDLLVEINLPTPAFGPSSKGTAANLAAWSAVATGSGIAGWARLTDAAGTKSEDFWVTGRDGGGDIELDNTNIAAGQTLTINAMTETALFGA